jgi:putative peptidoglycan lipid II flippase
MTRWLMPSIIATSLAGVTSAMLNAHHRFSSAALQGVAMNLVTIIAVLLLNGKIGIYALTFGTTLGLIVQLLIQLPEFIGLGRYRFTIDLRHPGLGQIWHLLGPIIIGSAAGQTALFFDRFFASTLPPGSISGMNYAIRIVGVPLQIFAAAIATVIFPLLSAQFAGSDHCGLKRSMRTALGVVNLLTIPAVGLCVVLAHPIVATLFQGGAFDRSATDLCSHLLPFAALALIPQAATMVLTRCCFAGRESRWTVAASVLSVVANIVLSVLLLPSMGARGLLLANAASQWLQVGALLFLVRKMVDGLQLREILWPAIRILAATTVMTVAFFVFKHHGFVPDSGSWKSSPILLGEMLLGLLCFAIFARLFGVEELTFVQKTLGAKVSRMLTTAHKTA